MDNEKIKQAKKKRNKKYLTWGLLAALVVFLTVMPLMAKQEVEEDGPVASVLSGSVEKGSVTTSLHGGGNLTAKDAGDVKLPSGVKITEFLVRNGDVVAEGDPVAAVDKVSVMTAIVEVTDTLETLQEQIEDVRDQSVDTYITATAGGRVKVLYGEKGEAVQDVMLRDGALAVLSLDGLMAVQIERGMELATGDSVFVTLSDGTEIDGRVEGNLGGVITVTVEDEGYEIGETVTVTTEDGDKVGRGTLYVHNAWKATAFTGTISAVNAKEETTVSSGSTLFTLEDTEFTAELEYLSGKHREYEALMQDLFTMYETGVICAPCGGVVSGVDKDSAHLLSTVPGEWEIAPLSNVTQEGEEKGWTVMLLSNTTVICTGKEGCQLEASSDAHQEGCIGACDRSKDCDATVHHLSCIKSCDHADAPEDCNATTSHYSDCIKGCTGSKTESGCSSTKHYLDCIGSCISSDGTKDCPATGAHKADCIEACGHADSAEGCDATLHHYNDCIKACITSTGVATVCSAEKHNASCYFYGMTYKATAAKVYAVGNTELVVNGDMSGTVYDVVRSGSGWALAKDAKLNTDLLIQKETTVSVANPKLYRAGDIILLVVGYKGEEKVWSDVVIYQQAQTSQDSSGGKGDMSALESMMAGLKGSMSGMAGMSGLMSGMTGTTTIVTQQDDGLFDLDGDVLLTVTPQDTVSLSITLDEHDITKVFAGMEAEVKVEALRDQVFEAKVVEIGTSGTNNGGSSKFTVKLELPGDENVLDGMSATATIPLYTRMDVMTIPVEALVEEGARTVVYTALDEKTGQPADPVEVEVGLSDGETAEILSGLKLGDTYYYSYYDTLELDTKAEAKQSFGF